MRVKSVKFRELKRPRWCGVVVRRLGRCRNERTQVSSTFISLQFYFVTMGQNVTGGPSPKALSVPEQCDVNSSLILTYQHFIIFNQSINQAFTDALLRIGHYRGMKFDRHGRKSYRSCDNCLDTELTLAHIFDCPAILAALSSCRQQISMWAILKRLPEQSSGPMVLFDLVPSWIRYHHHPH
ncbi:hypothetical protein TNCV_2312091 [Trichonephila clavipes]|nr:hypothetical protein TNCV_2312091 [Trichonephila clavipes]